MQLHNIQQNKKNRKSIRVGRGGKRGTYSGRGVKGQKARAGNRVRPAIRDLILRTPKLRGQAFWGRQAKTVFIVNLDQIEKKFKQKELINPKTLLNNGLIPAAYAKNAIVKILGDGEITKPHEFRGVKVSAKAKEKIKAQGGGVHD